MVKSTGAVIVEVDTPDNGSLHFRPLQRRVRGRFDVGRLPEPGRLLREWPEGIPGQRIGIDPASGEGFILEPLHDEPALKEKAEALGKLEPARQTFAGVDPVTWLHWIKLAVESGLARVVEGTLPDKIDGEPQTQFVTQPVPDPIDRLAAAMEKQTEMLGKVLAKLAG